METPGLILTSVTRIASIVIPVVAFLVFWHADLYGFYQEKKINTSAYSITELDAVIGEYQSQVNALDEQVQVVQKDRDWLRLKVKRISDSGRKVSGQLTASVISKETKTAQLVQKKLELEKILARYQKVYQTKLENMTPPPIVTPGVTPTPPGSGSVRGKITDIEMAVKKAGLDDWVQVLTADGGCARINNTLPILFSSGSAALAHEYKPFLKKLARFLAPYEVKVYVSGFTDPDPIRTPKYPSNLELGAFRAANIVHEMVRYGLKPDIFEIGSTGEYRFAAKTPSQKKSFQRRARVTVIFTG